MNSTIPKIIDHHAINQLPRLMGSEPGTVLLIADNITHPIAGSYAAAVLRENGISCRECILRREVPLVPDENAIAEIEAAVGPEITRFLSVGSGTITDLTRYISHRDGKPFVAIATAPSMDGYASPVAPLTLNGLKQTLPAAPPQAIIADTDILVAAPPRMIQAGLGDLLGKYTSLADWKLGEWITGEAFSPELEQMVRGAVDQAIRSFETGNDPARQSRDLLNALIISGEVMLAWGNSRPASGAEHHIAHFWEMRTLRDGKAPELHGIKVGVATILISRIYHAMAALTEAEINTLIAQYQEEPEENYRDRLEQAYGSLTAEVMADLRGIYRDPASRRERQTRILSQWPAIRAWIQGRVPTSERIEAILHSVGAPVRGMEIGMDAGLIREALENAREIRPRYTVFRLAEDIGWRISGPGNNNTILK